jgi:hypothetical protein
MSLLGAQDAERAPGHAEPAKKKLKSHIKSTGGSYTAR